MATKIFFILSLIFSTAAQAKGLTSVDSIKAFSCTVTKVTGFTTLTYKSGPNSVVKGLRNGFVPTQYRVNAAGTFYGLKNNESPKSQISLSGGLLFPNQFITLLSNELIPSGESKAVGSVYLVTMGGSMFAPIMTDMMPIGKFVCSSVTIK